MRDAREVAAEVIKRAASRANCCLSMRGGECFGEEIAEAIQEARRAGLEEAKQICKERIEFFRKSINEAPWSERAIQQEHLFEANAIAAEICLLKAKEQP